MKTMSDFTQPGATQALLPHSAKMLIKRDSDIANTKKEFALQDKKWLENTITYDAFFKRI
jgi:hypothetical protein